MKKVLQQENEDELGVVAVVEEKIVLVKFVMFYVE